MLCAFPLIVFRLEFIYLCQASVSRRLKNTFCQRSVRNRSEHDLIEIQEQANYFVTVQKERRSAFGAQLAGSGTKQLDQELCELALSIEPNADKRRMRL
jgi:hypothetical protein